MLHDAQKLIEYVSTDPTATPLNRALALICIDLMNKQDELRIRVSDLERSGPEYDAELVEEAAPAEESEEPIERVVDIMEALRTSLAALKPATQEAAGV